MKTYLAVPYKEKDEAKKLGAKWDNDLKQWYAPNSESVLINKWKMNTEPVTLYGEDTKYGGNALFIDLIPINCWFTNVRSCVDPKDWDRLRKYVYTRVNYICECCNVNTKESDTTIEAHERWDYNEQTQTQKLVRIVALCHECHQSTHMGFANVMGKGEEAKQHIMKVRKFTKDEYKDHRDKAYEIWENRNKINWILDLSLITSNNIKLISNDSIKNTTDTDGKE